MSHPALRLPAFTITLPSHPPQVTAFQSVDASQQPAPLDRHTSEELARMDSQLKDAIRASAAGVHRHAPMLCLKAGCMSRLRKCA